MADDLKQRYAALSDEELQKIRRSSDDSTQAHPAAGELLTARGVTLEPAAAALPPAPASRSVDLSPGVPPPIGATQAAASSP